MRVFGTTVEGIEGLERRVYDLGAWDSNAFKVGASVFGVEGPGFLQASAHGVGLRAL